MTLHDKTRRAKAAMAEAIRRFGPAATAVAWTGGKDSTVALHLYLQTRRELGLPGRALALSLDTGRKFPEVTAFRDRLAQTWDLDLLVVRPSPEALAKADPADKAACCLALKISPLRNAIAARAIRGLITGIRADEHPSRAARPVFETRQDPDYAAVNAILDFTLLDVWAHVADAGLPYCELYDQGYASLGCQPCTRRPDSGADERSGRDPAKEAMLPILHSLGYF